MGTNPFASWQKDMRLKGTEKGESRQKKPPRESNTGAERGIHI